MAEAAATRPFINALGIIQNLHSIEDAISATRRLIDDVRIALYIKLLMNLNAANSSS